MPHVRTCFTCFYKGHPCSARDKLLEGLKGLGVTSVLHACNVYRPAFQPGSPIKVMTVAWIGAPRSASYDEPDEPPRHWYPGHFVSMAGRRALVFVKPDATPIGNPDGDPFEAAAGGFVKAPLSRVRHSDWSPPVVLKSCHQCGAIPALGQACGYDPHSFHLLQNCIAQVEEAA